MIYTSGSTGRPKGVMTSRSAWAALAGAVLAPVAGAAQAPAVPVQTIATGPTYADLASLSDAAALVIRAQIRKTTTLPPERAPGLAPGFARLYVEATTVALIAGRGTIGAGFAYLVDVPRQADGRPPRLNRQRVLLFARPVDVPTQIRLVAPNAQLAWDAGRDATARAIAAEQCHDAAFGHLQ